MAWDLNGTNQYAQFAMSAALKAATGGPFTFGAVVNLDAATDGALIHFLDGASGRHFMEIFSTYNFGTASAAKSGPAGVGGGTTWVHIIMTKATGNVVPEYTLTVLGGAPTSGACTGGNLGNGVAPGAAGVIQAFRFGTSATEWVDGKVAALWSHASYMAQAAREALTTWALTVTACQVGGLGWAARFDTLSTIVDATGLGGNETARFGTSPFTLAADPSGAFFGSGSTVNATMNASLSGPTSTAAATVRHSAVLAATLPAPVATLAARPTVHATLGATLAVPVATLAAKVRHSVVLAAILPAPAASAQALVRVHAQMSATLPAPVATIVKDQTPYATATLTAGATVPARLTAGARTDATLTTGTTAAATLTAGTL